MGDGKNGARELVEAFRYLDTRTIATLLPLVSKRWNFISHFHELWTYLLFRDSGHNFGFYASPTKDKKMTYYLTLYNSQRQVPLLTKFPTAEFCVFNFETGRAVSVSIGKVIVERNPSWCFLDMGGILICGGSVEKESSRNSLILVGTMYTPVVTSNLCDPRDSHSLCKVNYQVFAFGGKSVSGDLLTCEKFNIKQQCWEHTTSLPLPLSNIAVSHTPNFGVFLLHAQIPSKLLKFDPKTELFEPFPIRFLSDIDPVSMFSHRDKLIIIGKEFSVNCDVPSHTQHHRFRSPKELLPPRHCWFVTGTKAYVPLSERELLSFEVNRCTFEVLTMRR